MSTIREEAIYEIKLKDSFSGPLAGMDKGMDEFESGIGRMSGAVAVFSGSVLAEAAMQMASFIKGSIGGAISLAMEWEKTTMTFETLLGSADAAKKTMDELVGFADVTPFETAEVVDLGKNLLAFKFQTDELIPTLTKLGDVASGMNVPLGDMVNIFGRMRSGDIQMEDMNRFIDRGIPIMQELEKMTGKTNAELRKMISKRQITFAQVDEAFNRMTAKGSRFGGMMDKLSQTLSGRWSTFISKIEGKMTNFGMLLIGPLGKALDYVTELMTTIEGMDFSAITSTFGVLWEQVKGIGEALAPLTKIFTDEEGMFGVMKHLITGFSLLMVIGNSIVFVVRTLLTLLWNIAGVLGGIAEAIVGLFTMDKGQMLAGMKKTEESFKAIGDDFMTDSKKFLNDQGAALEKMFLSSLQTQSNKSELDKKAAAMAGKPGGAAAAGAAGKEGKGAGVEKIQAGTRNVVVNIHTMKLADSLVSNKADLSDARLQEQLSRMLLTAVNNINLVAQ